jgi:hypothetical protein
MPRPENVEKIFDELLYEPEVLKQSNWNIHRSKNSLTVRTYINHKEYGRIAYIIKADSVKDTWLRISQYDVKKGIKDKEIINIPLDWLPEGYKEEFYLFLTKCLMVHPEKVESPNQIS